MPAIIQIMKWTCIFKHKPGRDKMKRKNTEQILTHNGYCEMIWTNDKSIWKKLKGDYKITLLKNGKTRTTTNQDYLDCDGE